MKHIMLEGRLGRDAEIRTTPRGNKYVTFTLAVNSKGKDGETLTDWYNVSSFSENYVGKFAEYLKKGSGLIVMGTPSYNAWVGKDGKAKIDLNVRATTLEFPSLDTKRDSSDSSQSNTSVQKFSNAGSEPEDDVPF